MANPPKHPDGAVDAELVYEDRWQDVEDVAQKVERAAESVLDDATMAHVREAGRKVKVVARIGREVEHLGHEVKGTLDRIEETYGVRILRQRTHPKSG